MGRKTKNDYQMLIATYKKRREIVKEDHALRLKRMSFKIKMLSKQIRLIEERESRVKQLGDITREFTGLKIRNSYPSIQPELVIARGLFYKYAFEYSKLRSRELAKYTGCTIATTPSRAKRVFNKRLLSDPDISALWSRYKQYIDLWQEERLQRTKKENQSLIKP